MNDSESWQILLQKLIQNIDIKSVMSLLLSGAGGVITFLISDRKKSKKRSQELQNSSLEDVYLPLLKILYNDDTNVPIEKISENCKIIDEKFKSKVLYIPPEHIRQMKILRYYLSQYNSYGDEWLKPIFRQYKRMSKMIDKYSNYLKKIHGFPYESTYVNYCSTTYSPRFSVFNVTLLIILWLTIYALFLIFNKPFKALVTALAPYLIYLLIKYGGRFVRARGGFIIVWHRIWHWIWHHIKKA